MNYGICLQALIPQRAEPKESSELVNQLLCGDDYKVVERGEKWTLVESVSDAYRGYIDTKCHFELSKEQWLEWKDVDKTIVNSLTSVAINGAPNLCTIGSALPSKNLGWFSHDYNRTHLSWLQAAMQFLNTPYLWGGKSAMGIDCSGFTQCIAKTVGIAIQRDAYQQALQGEKCSEKEGALAFFTNNEGRVTHVGIVLADHKIIHASGKVRIDNLTEEGIQHIDSKILTHTLSHFQCIGFS